MRAGLQVIGFDWRYVYVNHAAAAHGGRRPEDLVGRTMMEIYPGIESIPMFEMLRLCMSVRRAAVTDSLFTFPDGQAHWFEVRVEPSLEGICVYSFDIHDRKVRQLTLEARQAELDTLPLPHRLWRAFLGTRLYAQADGDGNAA
jgi:PAS domain S-box-containing protein